MPHREGGRPQPAVDPAGDDTSRDEVLVERGRAGDVDAFTALVERYQVPVYNLCLRLVGQPADAADVAQEVFLRVYSHLDRFRGDARFRTWLYRVAVNTCRDELRRRRRRPAPAAASSTGHPPAGAAGDGGSGDPARAVLAREAQAEIQAALGRLPEPFRAAVVLRDVHGLSYEEVAAVLGVATGTAKSRVHRGRVLLRDMLAAAGWLPGRGEGGEKP
ncbi:MAG: RNA polymerase subunit sigma-24 [Bacillota bacterium]|nr:MAG: RNA polymerase subunit sigma-24 [Bacillota bacterium]